MRAPAINPRNLLGLERVLFVAAALCLGAVGLAAVESAVYQAVQSRRLEHAVGEGPGAGPSPVRRAAVAGDAAAARRQPKRSAAAWRPGELIGRLEAPAVGLSAMVAEGVGSRTLRRAVGHVPGTALPGEPGNVAIAGHRDTFFRRLKDVHAGDSLRLTTPEGAFEYVVERTAVVDAGRTDLLGPSDGPTLTLITCHPFYYVGSAPDRFVVRARQVGRIGRSGG